MLDPLDLELQAAVSKQPDMVLGSKPGSSGRAANMLCYQLVSSAPIFWFYKTGPHCSSG